MKILKKIIEINLILIIGMVNSSAEQKKDIKNSTLSSRDGKNIMSAKEALKLTLNDPDSATFKKLIEKKSGAVCGDLMQKINMVVM